MRKLLVILVAVTVMFSAALASGTGAGTVINAISTNVVLDYNDGTNTFNASASSYGVGDVNSTIGEVHGLLQGTLDLASIGTPVNSIYKGLIPGQNYRLGFPYTNRGNLNDSVTLSASLVQAAARWSVANDTQVTINEDQLVTMYVTVNPATALNFERATLNVGVSIANYLTKNIASYNVLAGVVSSDMVGGAYGGLPTFNYQYVLEAQGVSLSIVSKTVSWNFSAGYNGSDRSKPMPGSNIIYTVVVKNNSAGVATSVNLTDKVPANCHLYYSPDGGTTVIPTVVGATAWAWAGSTSNTADQNTASAVKFTITIPANSTVTASYQVTVD